MRPRVASSTSAALASSAAARRVLDRHPGPPDVVWARTLPSNLAVDCCFVTDARSRRLRSADTLSTLRQSDAHQLGRQSQAFSAAGPRVCNYLPTNLRQPDLSSYSRFRQPQLTFLFVGPERSVNYPLTVLYKCAYLHTCLCMTITCLNLVRRHCGDSRRVTAPYK